MGKAKGEIETARRALAAGDAKHAAHHAAAAIAIDPLDSEALALLDGLVMEEPRGFGASLGRLFSRRGAVAPLFPDDGFVGNHAARARAHWLRGELSEALAIAIDLGAHLDDGPFVRWCMDIARDASAKGVPLDATPYLRAYADVGQATMGLMHLRATERAYYEPWAELGVLLLRVADPALARDTLQMATSALLRRMGDFARAVEVLGAGDAAEDWRTATPRGLALRGDGRWEEAIAAFEAGMRSSEDERTYSYEIARVHLDAGRLAEAREWFVRGGELAGEEAVAVEWIGELLDATVPRKWCRAFGDRPDYDPVRRLFLGESAVPMSDASTNALAQLEGEPPIDFRIGVSCLEAPSVLACVALRTRGAADPRDLPYSASEVPSPHPFDVGDRTLGVKLWERTGELVTQAIAPPPEDVSELVSDLVRTVWMHEEPHPPLLAFGRAWDLARTHPRRDELEPAHLFAAMIHPPRPERWNDVASWVFDRQVLAAMLLAAQDSERSWLAGRARESMQRLVFGHPDWTQAAALIALRQRLLDDPEALDDAREWSAYLLDRLPDRGHIPWAPALDALLHVPGMPKREASRIPRNDEHAEA